MHTLAIIGLVAAAIFSEVQAKTPSQLLGRQLCEETNRFRAEQGLEPFQISYTMEEIAQAHLDNLIEANHNVFNQECNMHSWYVNTYFGVTIPYCCYPRDRCMGGKGEELTANWNTKYTGRTGENAYASLGSGWGGSPGFGGGSVNSAVESWKNSPGHRALLVSSSKACGGVLNTTFSGSGAKTIGLLWIGTVADQIPLDYEGQPEDYGGSTTVAQSTNQPTTQPTTHPTPRPTVRVTNSPSPGPTHSPTSRLTPYPTPYPTLNTTTVDSVMVTTIPTSTSTVTAISSSDTMITFATPYSTPDRNLGMDSNTDDVGGRVSFFFLGAFSIGTMIAICLCAMMYKRWYWDANTLVRAEKGEAGANTNANENTNDTQMREMNRTTGEEADAMVDWETRRHEVRRQARQQARRQVRHQKRQEKNRVRREARTTRENMISDSRKDDQIDKTQTESDNSDLKC